MLGVTAQSCLFHYSEENRVLVCNTEASSDKTTALASQVLGCMDSDFNAWITAIFKQPLELQYEKCDEN